MTSLLSVRDVQAAYGTSQVIFGVDMDVAAGEVVALLGRNGMGKTTLIRALLGLIPPRTGSVTFKGQRIERWRPDRIARAGMALVPEGRQIFPNLTVRENLIAFARPGNGSGWRTDSVLELFPSLVPRLSHLGNQLSGGEQQMLAIGRALMTNPALLILDEASEGLAPLIRAEVWRCLVTLKQTGQSILVVDKYVERLIAIADRHIVLERGRVVWQGTSQMLAAAHDVWHRYLGV
jgi:branched-chain amino acid transport system ATP-binding protein